MDALSGALGLKGRKIERGRKERGERERKKVEIERGQ